MNSRHSRPDTLDPDTAEQLLETADTRINTTPDSDPSAVPPEAAVTTRPDLAAEADDPEPPVYVPSVDPDAPDSSPDDDPDGGAAPLPEELPAAVRADGLLGTPGDPEEAPDRFSAVSTPTPEERPAGKLRRLFRRG